jgi:hypothetical protein
MGLISLLCEINLMEYLLIAVLLPLLGFQFLLFYYNMPPKAALYRIIGRFFEAPEFLRPVAAEAPYLRIRHRPNRLHQPVLLNLETSDGSGQAVHPDVVYIPGGFGQKKWPYWMVCTPYPNGDEHFENPEIFVSYDGISWSIPDGACNPIVASPQKAGSHHSDPDILFHDKLLWMVYRQTIRGSTGRENILYLIKSGDGRSWSIPVEILRDNKGTELLSPALIHDGECFLLWTIENHGGEFHVVRRVSQDCVVWEAPAPGSTSRFENGRHPWHIDVIKEQGRLSAVIVSCTASNGGGARIHYAHSVDHGFHWEVSDFLFEQTYEFESSLQYRGTLRRLDDGVGSYQLWYSAVSAKGVSSIAYLPVIRNQDSLFPLADARALPVQEQASL